MELMRYCSRSHCTAAWLSRWCRKVCAAASSSASMAKCWICSELDRTTPRPTRLSLPPPLLAAVSKDSPPLRLNSSRFSCSRPTVSVTHR